MSSKTVIGIVGEKGSGKGTFTTLFKEVSGVSVGCVKSSDILCETLVMWHIPLSRSNLQQLAIIMDGQYGIGSLSRAVKARIEMCPEEIIVFEGIRWHSDVDMIRSFPNSFLIYVTASPEIRYKRTRARKEKVGEGEATFEQFMKEEQIKTETDIVAIGKKADIRIENEGSEEEFKQQIKEAHKKIVG